MAADIKFGLAQRKNPIPANIILWFMILNTFSWVVQEWLHSATIVGPHAKDFILQINGLVMLLCTAFAPLFGVNLGDARYVKSSDVTAVENNPETK
jgi:hypothetical protein